MNVAFRIWRAILRDKMAMIMTWMRRTSNAV
jgi:hypothetical protein